MAKALIYLGLMVTFIGILSYLFSKIEMPFGKIPGDIKIQKERYSIYFPIISSILLSLFLTVILNLIFWFLRK